MSDTETWHETWRRTQLESFDRAEQRFRERNARDLETVIAESHGRYPVLRWQESSYTWAAVPKWRMPCWEGYVGSYNIGRYTLLADQRRLGVRSGGNAGANAAEFRPDYPFKGIFRDREMDVGELRKVVAFDLYDWLDGLFSSPLPGKGL